MSYDFNGTTQTLTVADNPTFNLISTMTLSAWIKPAVIGINMQIFAKETSLGTRNWGLYYNALNKLGFELTTSVGGTTDTKQGILTSGVWQHVAVTYDGANKRFYINGIFVGQDPKTGTITNTTNALHIGSFLGGFSFFNGSIAHPTIWNDALTAQEITSLNAGYSPLLIRPQALTHYWPLTNGTQDLINQSNLTPVLAPVLSADPSITYPTHPLVIAQPPSLAPAHTPARFVGPRQGLVL